MTETVSLHSPAMTRKPARLPLKFTLAAAALSTFALPGAGRAEDQVTLTGRVVDAREGAPLPCRLYIRSAEGEFFTCQSAEKGGSAVPYDKRRGQKSVEIHTCLSAHPFRAKLPAGKYELTAVRGHEYLPATAEVILTRDGGAPEITLELRRWIHMADRGWFSGDTHCHRTPEELATVLPAEDLNVTFPLTSWVTDTTHTPAKNNKSDAPLPKAELVKIDDTHVFWPINTEYELTTVAGKPHPLGAFFVLNHREPLDIAAPPVGPVEKAAREQGALIDIDKHSWPWSMMLPRTMNADLFELANNHLWRTEFAFTDWNTEYVPGFMRIPLAGPEKHIDERGWMEFGFRTWYALLNTGLRMMPGAGTASGVHPVPLGFGRVYARLEDRRFDYQDWVKALKGGRTFVTTGPMLFTLVDETHPGGIIDWEKRLEARTAAKAGKKGEKGAKKDTEDKGAEAGENPNLLTILCRVESRFPIKKLEIVVNGEPRPLDIGGPIGARAPHSCFARAEVGIEHSSWIASRVFTETEEGRVRFAHTAPVWVEVKDKPLPPDILETNYLKERVEAEIKRNKDLLSKEALEEFEKALEFFSGKLDEAIEAKQKADTEKKKAE